jgi:hypothetical protein
MIRCFNNRIDFFTAMYSPSTVRPPTRMIAESDMPAITDLLSFAVCDDDDGDEFEEISGLSMIFFNYTVT